MKIKLLIAASTAVMAAACATPEVEPTVAPTPTPTVAPMSPQDQLTAAAGSDRVYFSFDQYTLTPQARQVLRAQAEFLKANPSLRVRVEGNCDERGTREYNLALGNRRANATKDFLVGLGVNPASISIISYGKDRPVDPRAGEAAWAKNRNTRTFIVGGSTSS